MAKRAVITASRVDEILKSGGSAADFPKDAIITPAAQERLKDLAGSAKVSRASGSASAAAATSEPIVPDYEFHWESGSDPQTPAEIEAFFHSEPIRLLKERIVDMGRRIWNRDYVDGNGGNITIRVGDDLVLCTPTLISKGFMTVDDIALVDMTGKQLAGRRKRTSEVNTHIGIMRYQPKAKACVHAHPPHATAFAVASVVPPTCMIPEAEVFLGQIGLAPYQTPGTAENAETVGKMGVDHQCIIMENHGVITWGKDVEDAYWKMENCDAYCKTVWIASQLGHGLKTFGPDKLKELINLRESIGMEDYRKDLKECELCDNSEFTPGVVCQVSDCATPRGITGEADAGYDPRAEAVVKEITDQIMARLAD